MSEREAVERAREGGGPEATEGETINDAGGPRVSPDEDGEAAAREGAAETPGLKPGRVEELEARARAAEQRALDVQSRFEQVRAELRRETDETRQRLSRAAEERTQRAKASFIAALLPVLDNLQRALEAAQSTGADGALLEGLRGTVSGFESALAQAGAEPVASVGAPFDPEVHEAVDTAAVGPERDGQVTAEYSRGYRIGNQLLRPARVQVGRAK